VTATAQLLAAAAALSLCAPRLLSQEAQQGPFRLDEWLGRPANLRFSGSERIRYEGLDGQFRAGNTRDVEDQVFSRLLLRADYTRDNWGVTVEGIDARAWGTKANSFANTTTVNTFDFLQASLTWQPADGHMVTVGRYTMDIGSRRLSARNRYRNTINSFNGVRWDYEGEDGFEAGAFWNAPTIRRPGARAQLVDNEHELDTQSTDFTFFGAHATQRVDERASAQVYLLGLSDHRDSQSSSRDLTTAGFRYLLPAAPGRMFGETEVAYQFGGRGAADVSAYFVHGAIGRQFDVAMKPKLSFALDVASGNDADDPDWNRFDTLFGARRWEYGPTGIYGAIGRRNLVSPEVRVTFQPVDDLTVMLAARSMRLAAAADGWREAGDTTGTGGDVGDQYECRVRWDVAPKSLRLEGGAAYFAGDTFRETSTLGRRTDTSYFYFQTVWTF
jgi:hypothetical protein